MDFGNDGSLIVVVRRSSGTSGDQGRCRRRRFDQGHHDVGFLGEDDGSTLLFLRELGGGKDADAGSIVLLLHVGGDDDHDIEFLTELNGIGSLASVVVGHRRWCHGAWGGGADHRRCSGRREGGRPIEFERSGSEKKRKL
jgi:hypothetical protein